MEYSIVVENLYKVYKIHKSRISKLKYLLNPFSNKYYNEFYALKDISFKVKKGEIVGIIGNNGAGKSTLLKILTGVTYQSSGSIEINGKVSSLLELGTGFNPEFTGIENIYLNGSIMGLSEDEIKDSIENIICFADIGEFIYQPVKSYSSGMYARLAFACAINVNPDILIVDEILSVGDIGFQQKCLNKFKEFKELGKTILYVSHSLDTVKENCERVIWLERGKIAAIGGTEIVEEYYKGLFEKDYNEIKKNEFVKLDNVEIIGKDSIDYGEGFGVKIVYNVINEDIKNPGITVELKKSCKKLREYKNSDQFVCSVNSNVDNFRIPWKSGTNIVVFKFNKLFLKEGLYYLNIIFSESQNLIDFSINENAICFNVVKSINSRGIAFLDHQWN